MEVLKMCGLRSAILNCSAVTVVFHIKYSLTKHPVVSGIHDVILVLKVSWIIEWCYVCILLALYWYPKVSAWRGLDVAWWIQTVAWKEVMCVLGSVGVCHLCMLLQSQKVVFFSNLPSRCAHVVVVLYETAIVLQSKSINLSRDAELVQS